ncbi:hypothetical protein LEP1GSC151_2769 [Leptospira interrogans serovar Grippotyphosa str. LT2186]|uniref:Uncharacterized protein n=1 Tax=Leptospira interrogans serovar Grippotyphosa str. LT2186 TaxID=1001599 RepID=M3GZQ4_LEPIR|nr:hypothetical protein [Leptospira interrogans]EKR46029.1 hypothetical protein LEP1GSC097_0972 [Leptospira interrogans serovar Grippotyphosa str. UI 08368]EMG12188.1 hypothetical protein LEP1GSC151_2769 [Leptospira interrogans serovar Grippotyphosa str. LT2186]EMN83738.1 hypothetical protein LEP1GSC107_1231 [Leptospira interrogans serovar Grippotyphosa str. UI 12769]
MSQLEIFELVLMYTVIGTLAGLFLVGIFALFLWYLIFKFYSRNRSESKEKPGGA